MSPFKRLKAEVKEANQEAASAAPLASNSFVEITPSGKLVAAYQDDRLLPKKEAEQLALKVSGVGERIDKTFKDYEGQSEYGTVIRYSV